MPRKENMEQVKSVFRRRKIEKLYEIRKERKPDYDFMRAVDVEQMYISEDINVLSDDVIGKYDIDFPQLEIGETLFLHDRKEEIIIKSKMRSSDNTIVYYAQDEFVETERTKRTHEECLAEMKQWDDRYNKLLREYNFLYSEFASYIWKHPHWLKLFWRK